MNTSKIYIALDEYGRVKNTLLSLIKISNLYNTKSNSGIKNTPPSLVKILYSGGDYRVTVNRKYFTS